MRILILRFSSMGDILLATPVLDILKEKYPDCQIDWVVNKKFEDVLNTNPLINKLIIFQDSESLKNIRREISVSDYDFIFDLHKNSKTYYLTRNKKNVFRYNKRVFERFMLVYFKKKYNKIIPAAKMYFQALEKAGISTPDNWKLTFEINKEIEEAAVKKFNLTNNSYIAIIPGASYSTKMWPKEYFRDLVIKIGNSDLVYKKIFLLGKGVKEESAGKFITEGNEAHCTDLMGKLSLQETAVILKYSRLVVTNDNGPMHLAECFNKKIIAIFGCTTEEFGFYPYSTEYKIIENKGLRCRPCTHFGRNECPDKHFKCMNDISVESVYETLKGFINV